MDGLFVQNALTWTGIGICLTQSAMFSGLNLAVFGIPRLRLEVEASTGNQAAARVLQLRIDSNFLLTTILWGNVAVNTLLALLSNSVLTGVGAFVFSTVFITLVGEIAPQAYFSRHALQIASLLSPVLRAYQVILYPVAKPSAKILDWWLGEEGILYFRERDLREVIKKHVESADTDIDRVEGLGALNFLAIDDLAVSQVGEQVDPESIITLAIEDDRPAFPRFASVPTDSFLRQVEASGKKWVIITDASSRPRLLVDSNAFLRDALFQPEKFNPYGYCHRPVVVTDGRTPLGSVMRQLKVHPEHHADNVIDDDVILVWGTHRRVITGADILGRLLREIVTRETSSPVARAEARK